MSGRQPIRTPEPNHPTLGRSSFGLAGQFNLLAISLVVFSSLSVVAFAIQREVHSDREALLDNGLVMARLMAATAEYAVYTEDEASLRTVVEGIDADEGLSYAAVLDAEHRELIFHSKGRPALLPPASWIDMVPREGMARGVEVLDGPELYYDLVVPVVSRGSSAPGHELSGTAGDETIGYVRLGLSSEPLRDSARALLLAGLGFAGVLVLLGVGITVLLTRRIVEPINQLVEASRNVAEGDLDHPVIVSSHGEIGELAQAFNHMVDNLRATQRKVEAHSGALQETVEQLLAATEEAQAFAEGATVASKAKSAFLASMSHELRTPLNAIIGYTEMLVEEAEEEGFEVFTHDLARVHTAAEQLLSLINEVLDLSKIEAGLMTVELESVDLRPVLDEIGVVVHPMAETNRVEVAIHYDASLVRMQTNAQRLRQILLNLVTNAVKFTSRGKVEVSVRQVSDEGEWLEIAVVDTGMGMTEEQLSRVFEPFVQGDDSTARNYGGTGLGLTISRHFAELMGGSLQAVSTYGEGSTFTLRLPLSTDSAPHTLRPGLLTSDDLRGAA